MSKLICEIFRSPKKEGLYLYVEKAKGLKNVPDALLESFGRPQAAMTLLLTPDKKLANADIDKVLAGLEEKGYYLQLPPALEDYMRDVHLNNSKFPLS